MTQAAEPAVNIPQSEETPGEGGLAVLLRGLAAKMRDGDIAGVLRGAAFVMGIRVLGAVIALAGQILLARWMGAFEYGIFSYVWVWVIVLGIIVPMGFGTSVLRFVPDYKAREKWRRLAGMLQASWYVVMALSFGAVLVGGGLLLALRGVIDDYFLLPLFVGLLCVPGFALMDWQEGAARAFGWVNLAYLPTYVLRPLGIVLAAGGIMLAGLAPTGLHVIFGALGATMIALILQRALLMHRVRKDVPSARPVYHLRHWWVASVPLVLVEGFYLVLSNTDIVLLGQFVDPDKVGIYFAATRIANLMSFIYFAFAAPAAPKFAELHASGKHVELQKLLRGVVHSVFWPTLVAALGLLLFGGFALSFFGPEFRAGAPVLWILMIGFLAHAAFGPTEHVLNMTGHQKATAWAYGAAALCNIALNIILIPQFGLEGAAVATSASVALTSIALAVIVKSRLGISSFVGAGCISRFIGQKKVSDMTDARADLSGVDAATRKERNPALSVERLLHAARYLHDAPPDKDVVVLESAEALSPYAAEIDALGDQSADPNTQFESVTLGAAIRHLVGGKDVEIALVWSDPNGAGERALLGVFPYRSVRGRFGFPLPVWQLWTHIHSYNATPLLRAGREKQALSRFLAFARQSGGVAVEFPLYQGEGAFADALDELAVEQGLSVSETDRHARAFLQSDLKGEEYFVQTMRKKKRKEYARLWNRLAEEGDLKLTAHDASGDLEGWMDRFLALEAKGWKGTRGTALKEVPEEKMFFEEICRGAQARGKLHCLDLTVDGTPIAMLASFRAGRGLYTFKICFDEDYSRFSPGAQLMMRGGAMLLDDPRFDWVDSCALPDHPMIDHIWAERRVMRSAIIGTGHVASAMAVPFISTMTKGATRLREWAKRAYYMIRKELEHGTAH